MNISIEGGPAFSHIHLDLEPGESIVAESDAMATMDADLDMQAELNGDFITAILKKYLGGESLFVSRFTNRTQRIRRLTLTQATPGEIRQIDLEGQSFCLQPGAYIASMPGVKLGIEWAGFKSFIAREGLFRLRVSGHGTAFYGAYGCLIEKELDGQYIVDTSHLVASDPGIKLNLQLAGGIFSSFFGGEGIVTRLEGKGKFIIQTRSVDGLVSWLNPKL